jgi:TolB-like protein/Tfp pilus assembly protein PilF
MHIWSSEIKEIEKLYESLKGQLPELEKELERLVRTDDENIVLVYSRRCLEVIITDLCEYELKRPRKTEPLKGIIDKLKHEEKVPVHIIASMESLNSLSTFGAHPKDFDPEQVKPVLSNLTIIIRWYLKYKDSQNIIKEKTGEEQTISKIKAAEEKYDMKEPDVTTEIIRKPFKKFVILLSGFLLVVFLIFAYLKIFRWDRPEDLISSDGRISLAVMPFRNMTNDTTLNVWQDGIKDNLITYLSNFSEDLSVRQIESVNGLLQNTGVTNYASLTPSVASAISQKLDANIFISGSISQAGNRVRVNAQLINSKTEEAFKSFQIEGTSEEEIFTIIDSLSVLVKDFLIISVMEREIIPDFQWLISTSSAEAYRCYVYGNQAFYKRDWSTARDWYLKASEIDTNFTEALRMLTFTYKNPGMMEEAKKTCLRNYRKKDRMSIQEKIWADVLYSYYFETPYETIKYFSLLIDLDEQMPVPYSNMAGCYEDLHQYEKAISLREKELEIYDKWGSRPRWSDSYASLGKTYHLTGQYKKERRLYSKAEQDFPDDDQILYRQAILSLTERDTIEANQYIEKYISARRISSVSEATIAADLAAIYYEADIHDKAEKYHRKALLLEPENPVRLNNLAWFLIDNDRNINEGLELVDKALNISPDYYNFLYTKGWGLYKQEKYEEALEILQKCWDSKPWHYHHEIYLHLEEVKKAISNQKSN